MSKRQEIRERRRKQKQQRKMMTIGMIVIGAGLILAVLIFASPKTNTDFRSRYMAQANTMGDPDAPIKIVEFSDYKCGHCANFTIDTEPLLEEDYIKTGKVHFTYRSVGAMIGGAEPMLAAEASYCAGEQNMFWEMHDIIFANQPTPFSNGTMEKWAKAVGVDMDAYKSCMSANTYQAQANQDEADAKAEGISGTPSFIISYMVDGEEVQQLLPGNYPYGAFQDVIDGAMVEMGLE